jgi:hypothetical protein
VLWFILGSDLYGFVGAVDENLQVSVIAFRHRLLGWYKRRHQEFPEEVLTRVNDFTIKMLGTRTKKKCKTKGAETWGLALFLIEELRLNLGRLGERGARLLLAGECLQRLVNIWEEHGRVIPQEGREDSRNTSHSLSHTLPNQQTTDNDTNNTTNNPNTTHNAEYAQYLHNQQQRHRHL